MPDGQYETVIMHVALAPNFNTGLHTHPGFDAAYLLEGGLDVLERGEPAKPIRPGESARRAGRRARGEGRRAGRQGARRYVVERGKPLATPWAG